MAPEPDSTQSAATSAQPTASAVDANGETIDVVVLDNTFRPERVEVDAGTMIRALCINLDLVCGVSGGRSTRS